INMNLLRRARSSLRGSGITASTVSAASSNPATLMGGARNRRADPPVRLACPAPAEVRGGAHLTVLAWVVAPA
ncbi:MAG TPA: hypothetical protein VKD66_17130, partial [Streptosporangiaceae bacterium]|nr:hypothetical protein [Streptosporangiaceae bacterium]